MVEERQGKVQEKLERYVVEKLNQEWHYACWGVRVRDPELAARARLPGICITEMAGTLGSWNLHLYEISLSRELVLTGRWDSVREVFHHEMAHQFASLMPGAELQPPHGPLFRDCCRMLGANPKASGSYQTLEERVWENQEEDRMMLKVKKLMSLASSANPHEARQAAAKAGELIMRYNLDVIDKDRKRRFESIIITQPRLKRSQARSMAAVILGEYYFVKPVWIPVWMPEKGKMGRALEISGTSTNLLMADYVFHFILQYARTSWKQYKKENPACRSRAGYMTGVVIGFRDKLAKQRAHVAGADHDQGSSRERLPVSMEDGRLVRYWERRYPSLSSSRVSHGTASRAAYDSGLESGRDLSINKPISSRDQGGRGMGLITARQ